MNAAGRRIEGIDGSAVNANENATRGNSGLAVHLSSARETERPFQFQARHIADRQTAAAAV